MKTRMVVACESLDALRDRLSSGTFEERMLSRMLEMILVSIRTGSMAQMMVRMNRDNKLPFVDTNQNYY